MPDTCCRAGSRWRSRPVNKLDEICATKREEVAARKALATLADLEARASEQTAPRGFRAALETRAQGGFALIAEIKKASPSKGLIRANFHPRQHAIDYEKGGAACLSVLTDAPYFQGHEDFLIEARASCALPVLRKDFMVDPWQVAEARSIGADAILIIVAALDDGAMTEIEAAAIERGMDVLVEVHDEAEMERAARLQSRLIGVNNRDLRTFTTDLATTERLSAFAPDGTLLVGESGINSHADCQRLSRSGVRAFLVGESLMRQDDVVAATRTLLDG
ncbi:MAG: indole-3-glycerol phosphate synthase TrpC [Sphingomonadaceae bacterium]|nr:indole-3-glycerol phosphate synthase TrpC [Sphingomonadaceae bacterium]MCP5383937.1 indole-3-glycerol phosphate synthase TrpC [Altererythrobacter sp.]MCP5390780.1 indole-3-glycerol phosphate synthase TrpC [Sphingomonadaceae bacterium]MCP5394176.1 indole-3-glycerol phosphate synthase TrpC [Sphingomonadaceae bacterium]